MNKGIKNKYGVEINNKVYFVEGENCLGAFNQAGCIEKYLGFDEFDAVVDDKLLGDQLNITFFKLHE